MPEPAAPTSSDEEATGTADEATLTEVTARPVHIASQTSMLGKTSVGEQAAPGTGPREREEVGALDRPPRPGGTGTNARAQAEAAAQGEVVAEEQVPPFVLLVDRASADVYLLAVREESEPPLSPAASTLDASPLSSSVRDKYAASLLTTSRLSLSQIQT